MRLIATMIVGFHAALLDAADRPQKDLLPRDYQRIATLNPFNLSRRSAPHSISPETVSTHPPSDLRLSGITSTALKRLAYFVQNEGTHNPRSFALAEGQKNNDLELLAIDLPAESVKVRCGSAEFSLSLKSATLKSNGSASAREFRGPAGDGQAIGSFESYRREVPMTAFPPVK